MAKRKKPNVLLILADDIGWFDIGAYHRGMMGGATPNIQAGTKNSRVHLDGYNRLPYLAGESEDSARHAFFYYGEHELSRQAPPDFNPSAMIEHAIKAASNAV